ncbi:zinc finger protein 728-like [Phlebotomus argentipes]|uniref:zinc finger protein 728-like n=1 Tax=Phlebotomus argentipes TaxID=94469 RepID=UPI002892A347|nr:zinc finger protein 728-like [Phlebotomus argentipes]
MSQVCRFCGSSDQITVNLLENPIVMTNVEVCLARKVSPEDCLPTTCCSSCRETLEEFANFVAMANETEKKLRELEKKTQTEISPSKTTRVTNRKRGKSGAESEGGPPKRDVTTIVKRLSGRADLTVKIGSGSGAAEKTPQPVTITGVPSYFLCMNCRERFDSFEALSRHMKTPGQCQKKEYKCGTCSRTFDTRKKFYQHSMSHRERSSLICDQCGKTYSNRFNLENHKSSVHGDAVEESDSAIYRCRLCSQQFNTRVALFSHIEAHDKPSRQAHLCDRCGKCFVTQETLKSHSRTHASTYKCQRCGEEFPKKMTLVLHECPRMPPKRSAN